MPKRKRTVNKEYSDKLKSIRSYVNFDYDLRKPLHANSKRKIDRYFDAIHAIQARPNKVYRSKNKQRVKEVQEFGRNGFEGLPGITVGFYESSKANPITLRFDKKGLVAKGKYFDIRYVPFRLKQLVENPDKELKRALADPGAQGANWFRVAVGEGGQYSIPSPTSRNTVANNVKRLMTQYSDVKDNGEKAANHYTKWLHGLLPMTAKNQTEVAEFLRKEGRIKDDIANERKKARNRAKARRNRQRNRSI